jgi:hypothetical protein
MHELAPLEPHRYQVTACPHHWIIWPCPEGWQEIVETTGGSPAASRLFIDDQDTRVLRTRPDPGYLHEITAVARLRNGTRSGGCSINCATPQRDSR